MQRMENDILESEANFLKLLCRIGDHEVVGEYTRRSIMADDYAKLLRRALFGLHFRPKKSYTWDSYLKVFR